MSNHIAQIVNRHHNPDHLQQFVKMRLNDANLDDIFIWEAEISSSRMDAYFTHMLPNSINNFVRDLRAGVSFQDSHARNRLGYGQSLDGEYLETPARAIGTFYTVSGIKFNANSFSSTDDFIRAVQSGIVRDVSIGFYGGRYICDLCHTDYRACSHWAGMEYERDGDVIVCTVAIDNASLAEVSVVYDGATPGAVILKAQEHARAGKLEAQTLYELQTRYRVELPVTKLYRGAEIRSSMDDDEIKTLKLEIEQLKAEISRLTPLANAGTDYLAKLKQDLIAEGIRAQGENFPTETYQILVQNMSHDQILSLLSSFHVQASQRLPGGRFTQSASQSSSTASTAARMPREAYRS